MPATHSQKLEGWIPRDELERISAGMKDWYGPPIAMGNVPGNVYACAGGDFRGHIEAGSEASFPEYVRDQAKRIQARASYKLRRWLDDQMEMRQLNTGFASISDLITKSRNQSQYMTFNKTGPNGVVGGVCVSMWGRGQQPAAGGNGAAAPGGTVHTKSDTGAFNFRNPNSPDTQYFTGGVFLGDDVGSMLLYDRLFSVAKTMSSSGTEAVTGVPTRYQNSALSSTSGDLSCKGNFAFPEISASIANTAHNWTVCKYTNQEGDVTSDFQSVTGFPNLPAGFISMDGPSRQWFMPLASGDSGLCNLKQMQCSSAVITGGINFVVGHPIAWFPCLLANVLIPVRAIQSSFQLEQILDGACLTFLELHNANNAGTTFSGYFRTVSG